MVLMKVEYEFKEDKIKEYLIFNNEENVPFFHSAKGFKEMRAYRDDASGKVLVLMDFKDFEALGKIMDSDEYKELMKKFAYFTKNLTWELWDASPVLEDLLKPL